MFLVTMTAILVAASPLRASMLPRIVLIVIAAGSLLTALRRLLGIARALREPK
jgi:ABC-type molybdate transport system substrate-binding protein